MAAVNLLETKNLTKQFGGLTAVNGVSFELPAGQVRALIGPNGAGKSTLVGLLCGRIEATAGDVFFEGHKVTHIPAHKRIGMGMAYTFQITSIFGKLSLHENVALAARPHHKGGAGDLDQAVFGALGDVGLQDRAEELASDLSYGHQRLLEIAMGIVQKPKLLILDEPTQGLADVEVEQFNALIKRLSETSTILLIEHNMNVVMETADFITVLNFGEVLAEGTPQEVRANKLVQDAYLGAG
ncbi:MAG: ABC transporter ATP-binding protein [Rhizobiaceae bacterium]|nr:ABC transporter ATP-binding protein [Rhizobiaceae bacterium]